VIDFSEAVTNKNGIGTKPDIPKPDIKPAPMKSLMAHYGGCINGM